MAAGLVVGLVSVAAPSAFASSAAPHSMTAASAPHSAAASHSSVGLVLKPDASGGTTICAHTNTKYCADVVGDSNTVGTKIWLYPNGADDKWDVVVNNQGCSIIGIPCYFIKDAQNASLCLSATGAGGAPIELEKCNENGSWYDEGNYILGNGHYGESGNLDAQAIGTHDYLYALEGGKYDQFTVYGFN